MTAPVSPTTGETRCVCCDLPDYSCGLAAEQRMIKMEGGRVHRAVLDLSDEDGQDSA